MRLAQTHTYVTMPVSAATYKEIKDKLIAANYDHCFVNDAIVLQQVGLVVETPEIEDCEIIK